MDKNNSIVKAQTTSIQRVSKQLDITSKLLAERHRKLRIWWEGLDDLWQDIFLINLAWAAKFTEKLMEEEFDIGFGIYEDYETLFGCKFKKPQEIKAKQLKEISLLKELYCWGTEISSLESLRNLTNLHKLDCSYTIVGTLEPLRNLTNLRELRCKDTKIDSLEPLRNLTNLAMLNCSSPKVNSLEPLKNLTNLQKLNC